MMIKREKYLEEEAMKYIFVNMMTKKLTLSLLMVR